MVICTHFKDKNLFSDCMPLKETMTLIYISKTTMSSVIACLQRRQWPSFTFQRRKYLQSLHAFKGDNVIIYMSKTTMSSVIACLQKATMSSFAFQRRQCLHIKNFNILFWWGHDQEQGQGSTWRTWRAYDKGWSKESQGSSSTSVVHTIWIQAQVSRRKVQGCELYHGPNGGRLNGTTLSQF